MKLTFLGTSAGESYPAIWCDCENCSYARRHGGRNIRVNTGTMIDNDILIDMNAVSFHTAARLGVSLTQVTKLLVTHPHPDHLAVEPLDWRMTSDDAPYRSPREQRGMVSPRFTKLPVMTMYGNAATKRRLDRLEPDMFDGHLAMRFREIREGEEVTDGDLAFVPVRAIHGGEPGFAHSYIIKRGGKTLLYALDTGGYEDDMMALILKEKYDGVVMEGTFGLTEGDDPNHMTYRKNAAFRDRLREAGCISDDTPFFLTHMSPHWTPPYDIYAPMMKDRGFIVAYDGMTARI